MDGRVLIIQHTLLPGMKQGWDLKTGLNSWRSLDDPSPADYSYGVELNGLPQLVLRKGSTELYRSGLWYEDQFIGVPVLTPNSLFKPQFISNSEEVYYMFETTNPLLLSRLVMGQSALVQHLTWISHQHQWAVLFTIQKDRCDNCRGHTQRLACPSRTFGTVVVAERNRCVESYEEDVELPSFDLNTIVDTTNQFSFSNKIGEGGFGPVYKGLLPSGREVAVKRLLLNSRRGLREWKNEVILISKLQHRNLVRLLGCCIHGEARMLIYEFMANKSLDGFIFGEPSHRLSFFKKPLFIFTRINLVTTYSDKARSTKHKWKLLFNIFMGGAQGLLYLHQDSKLRITTGISKPAIFCWTKR
ncbi:hypothetical protein LguiA_023201 [Lonicera macranthoides]